MGNGSSGEQSARNVETDKALTVSAELPGLTEKDVRVEIANGVLTLRGEKKAERSGEGRYFTERSYGAFERQFPLEGVEEDKAEAAFKDGSVYLEKLLLTAVRRAT